MEANFSVGGIGVSVKACINCVVLFMLNVCLVVELIDLFLV